ncbi:MAG: DUF5703 domain-containing protein [Bacteroidales bacterium]|jgi:hypothetical protein|nr:DUF5703 domain-containing protein [Bacteroidales bacterium]
MKKYILYLPLLLFSYNICQAQESTILAPDYPSIISASDLIYQSPAERSEEGMPVGNGITGSLIWTSPSAMHFQINRVDVFGNNAQSHNFYERHTDYCGGAGFVDVEFPGYDEVFTGDSFRQRLSCYQALVSTEGKQVKTETFVWSNQDVLVINVENHRTGSPVIIRLRALRPAFTKKGDHSAVSKFDKDGNRMVLTQTFKEKEYLCTSAVAVSVDGADTKSWQVSAEEMTLTVKEGSSSFRIYISSAASFDKEENIATKALRLLDNAHNTGYDQISATHKNWWKAFWERSFIHLKSSDGVADKIMENYHYFLYVMGSSSRGEYEPKFNGMLWTTGGDSRKWGNLFWGANQSCYYNGLFPANRPEIMAPHFRMYSRMYPSLQKAARQQWGSEGIFIPETVGFDGLPELPENIASEMRDLYLTRKTWPERSTDFTAYSYTRMPFNSRWNWKKDDGWKDGIWHTSDKGGGTFGHVTHIFSRGAKIAYQYWMQYEYSQDKEWLAGQAYPMLKGVAEFYRNFPNLKKEQDGKYHIRHINDNESVWDGHNTVEEISSMMGIFPVAIKAAEILNVDADLRKKWNEILSNLSPLTLSSDYPNSDGKPVTFVRSLSPVLQGPAERIPDSNTMPVWYFDLCTLESTDKKMMETANNTYDAYFSQGIKQDSRVYVLSKLPVTGTQLGRKDATRYLIPNQIQTAEIEVLRNRMDLREGFQTTGVQRLGRVADALHYALCQGIPAKPGGDHVIRVFPAWPEEWDAQFTLLCRGNFLVTSSFKNSSAEFVEIRSNAGKECNVRNPWGTEEVTIYRNGKKYKTTTASLISFPTRINEVFVLVKGKTKPEFLSEKAI